MGDDSIQPLEPGAVAMISQSGNVAVNALGSRRGIRGTRCLDRQPGVCDASDWLAAICELDGVSVRSRCFSSPTATGSGSPRRWRAAPGAGRVAVLKVGESAAQRLGGTRAHRRAGRGSPRLPGAGRGGRRRRLGERPARAARLAQALSEPPGAAGGDGGLAVLTARAGTPGIAADLAARADIGASGARPEHPRRARRAAAGRGDGRQPARLHGADLG